jgi:hypothetical protein
MSKTDITNSDDIIDVRDVIARFEELENEVAEAHEDSEIDDVLDMRTEMKLLQEVLDDLKGNGGDEQWRGDWYPVTLIRDSYFDESFVEEEAESMGLINAHATWPNNCIDWAKALEQYQMDYTSFEFDGVTYWYR